MIIIIFSIGDEVRIISNDEYNGHYGIITHIDNYDYMILTVKSPVDKYRVRIDEAIYKLVKCK